MAIGLRIGFIGPGHCSSGTSELAEDVGREIARQKGILICGGMGGAMEAACRGAREEGGTTIGILPGTSALDANPFIDIPIVTDLGQARNVIVVRSSEAIIALRGGFGTLSEIAFALKLGVPLIGLSTWTISSQIIRVSTPEEAVTVAMELAEKRR